MNVTRFRRRRCVRSAGRRPRLDIDHSHEHERHEVEARRHQKRRREALPTGDQRRRSPGRAPGRAAAQSAPGQWTAPCRPRRRRFGRHRQAQRAVARRRSPAPRGAQTGATARWRTPIAAIRMTKLTSERATITLRPKRSARRPQSGAKHGRHRRRHAERHARPGGDGAHVVHAHLLDVDRQKRHHQREAGEADEDRGGQRGEIAPPERERSRVGARPWPSETCRHGVRSGSSRCRPAADVDASR